MHVTGVVREVARRIYETEVIMKVQERKQEHLDAFVTEHVVFVISQVETGNGQPAKAISSKPEQFDANVVSKKIYDSSQRGVFDISSDDFSIAFPYHICFDKDLFVEHFGHYIRNAYPMAIRQETRVSDILELVHPEVPLSYESILAFKNSLFVFKMRGIGDIVHQKDEEMKPILLKGSMILIGGGNYILYISSVYVTTVRELIERNLHISDMQRHDGTRDLIMLNQSRMSQVELKVLGWSFPFDKTHAFENCKIMLIRFC
ncbi:unnamed protein product [Cylicostephanus goldi]|uniref:guanylate cyclase n=1 Tax=Cylicostephanus goldi TaxID=71465 RepID=A0A3P6RM21_CYLGO|nr:unnamed protein product [Cylicostephanus goldi]